ncbi:DUF1295 domain-containing protein [Streptomyces sp. NPDC006784]|uniref:DUF1295 domain-containing protein n=1 Tax=Streptomyces sp. NPDC006784 TaxID=3364764 RepID=UPI0036A13B97
MTGGTDWSALGGDVWATIAAVAAVMLLTFAVALRKGVHRIVDIAWGVAFAAVALATYGASAGEGDPARRALVTALTVVWGLRLAGHIAGRGRGKGEDPRYARMLDKAPGNRNIYALRKVYLLQGALVLVVSLPVQAGQYAQASPGPAAWAGCAVWLVGMFFETVGDAQLARFTARPENRGTVMDRGLWSWTRHPNYFGDFCVWWGLYLVAVTAGTTALAVLVSPLLMSALLTVGSGKRLLEQHMADRPGYAAYAARTSGFFPLPPRRAADRRSGRS